MLGGSVAPRPPPSTRRLAGSRAVADGEHAVIVASRNPAKVKAVEGALRQAFPALRFTLHPTR
jgi:hypothetical protein